MGFFKNTTPPVTPNQEGATMSGLFGMKVLLSALSALLVLSGAAYILQPMDRPATLEQAVSIDMPVPENTVPAPPPPTVSTRRPDPVLPAATPPEPNKNTAVTFMFDDGGVSTYTEAKPILDRYGYKASMSIVTDFIGEPKFMTLEQIQSLAASGWEVVSHGITHDDLTRMSSAAWHDEMARSKKILEGFGFTVRSFVVPYGAYNADIIRYGTPLYSSIRAYEAGDNPAGSSPYRIRVRQITNVTTPAEVAQWIQEGKSKGRWEVLAFHVVDTSSDDEYYTPPSVFAEMVAAVQASGVPVLTYGQGIARFATVGGP